MSNHYHLYHLLVERPNANLSQGMRQLNGAYTRAFNRGHNRVGHVLQGRDKAILIEKESHLLELARYISSTQWGQGWSASLRLEVGVAIGQRLGKGKHPPSYHGLDIVPISPGPESGDEGIPEVREAGKGDRRLG